MDTQSDEVASSEDADTPEGIGDSAADASGVGADVADAVIGSAEVIVARAEAKPLLERVVEAARQLETLFDLASYTGALDDDVRAAIEAARDDVLSSMLDFALWVAGPTGDEDDAR
ncbi:MAG: hypothetical protein M3217_01585 [Actinomycetota bacterium]|nr:hypothetical protein [Actinomycetota bacterium]